MFSDVFGLFYRLASLLVDNEQQYQKPNADCKGSLFQCVFLLSTKIYTKRVECRYNHIAKFSVGTCKNVCNHFDFYNLLCIKLHPANQEDSR